ncbi:MAG TPA: CPBP family intramembrane glutamic endopeptidase [Acidobacteriaceae bacterium]|nr:CPBP family intramembrane glutamic endopeptidase [Acidobacteriaceae bacterium]
MNWNAYPAPELLPPAPPEALPHQQLPVRETPTLLETVAFFTLAAILLLGIQGFGAAVVLHWHLFGHIGLRKLVYETRFTIPIMLVSYGAVLLAAATLFRRVWMRPFLDGIHWNFDQVRQYWPWLLGIGIGLGFGVQLASNFLPVPKELPVDEFFRTALDAWMVALFGVFVAPIAEEIAFRGFLYPSLRRWTGMVIAAILTSIPFALLHAQQVAHAWGPLAMVFLVSVILVAVRERTRSVAASALVHACYNLSIFIVIFYGSGGFMHLERLKN